MNLLEKINKEKLPKHVAIIMDGNGRWAAQQGKERFWGHKEGMQAVKNCIKASGNIGLKYLTLYTFSTENWNRPVEEVNALMELLVEAIQSELEELHKNGIRLHTIGDISKLPDSCKVALHNAKEVTKNNDTLHLIMALSYSGKAEILQAVKSISEETANGSLKPEDINEAVFEKHLYTSNFPDPELLIRTSGEYRISNFLLWQLAYAEFYFTEKLWPEFNEEELCKAIIDYQNRERRFGKTSAQVQTNPSTKP